MNVPALRFPEFEGEWDDTKAGDAFDNSRAKGEAGLPIYSVTMNRGLVRRDSLDRHMHGDAADETNLRAKPGDIVYNMMRMWQGAAGIAEEECMVSPAYVVLSPKEQTSSEFFNYRIENARMLYLLWAYSHGLTSDRLRLYFGDFARIPMLQPALPEQKKIAAFLGVVDAKIAALRARVAGLERYKRGLMQALFSQALRFTKPDGTPFPDWQEKQLGDLSTKNDSGIYKKRDLYGSGHNIVGVSDLFGMNAIDGQEFRQVPLDDVELAKNTLDEGDILYAESSLVRAGIAKAVYVTARGAGTAFAWHTRRFSVNSQIANSAFIFYYLESEIARRYIEAVATQTALTGITTRDYFKTPVFLPHPDEQAKIAEALSAMDAKIAAVTEQLEQMQDFKKGLLQQMFV